MAGCISHIFFDLSHLTAYALPEAQLPRPQDNPNPWLALYFSIIVTSSLVTFARVVVTIVGSFAAARKLFTSCLARVAYAPFRW